MSKEHGGDFDLDALRDASREDQLEMMEDWFRLHYEDPAQRTPYESAEGGYIYIWGGPYDAREELEQNFQDTVAQDVIDELVEKLQGECWDWAPTPRREDYDSELYAAIRENQEAQNTFDESVAAVQTLLALKIQEPLAAVHRRLLFANVITAMETFLSDTFVNRVLADDDLLQKYLDTEKAFADRKFPLNKVLQVAEQIKAIATKELLEMVWHNIAKVKALYKEVLAIDLGDLGLIAKAIQIRHDIVHRNGRQRDGAIHDIKESDITDLISQVRLLTWRVFTALNGLSRVDDEADPVF
jgi:hypothetical protein